MPLSYGLDNAFVHASCVYGGHKPIYSSMLHLPSLFQSLPATSPTPSLVSFFQTFYDLLTKILYPLSPVTLNASIFMTLALTVERYLAVCMPLRYR